MSRIGTKPVQIPSAVTVQADGEAMVVKGPKGTLRVPVPPGVHVEKQDGHYVVKREGDEQAALHGLARSLLANAVRGVAQGFEKHLDIVGIGYRAEVKGKVRGVYAWLFAPHRDAHPRRVERSRSRSRPIWWSAGQTNSEWDKWRRKFAGCGLPTRIRTRASDTRASG